MKRKILIVGNSANAYAIAKKLSEKNDIYVAPACDFVKDFATVADIREDSISELLDFVLENEIDMTIPVSQKAIEANITSVFNTHKQAVFAPSSEAMEIVTNKALAKKILYKLRIPTPKFGIFEKQNMALDYIKNQKIPFVIKTNDRNSATVLTSVISGKKILESMNIDSKNKVIIEDYAYGTPFSFYAVTDGYKALPFGSSITYKHSLEGEGGQITSGMGSCSPNYKLSYELEYSIMDNIIYPTLEYLEAEHKAYLGILGINGILTDDGQISVLGWQSFMQDCDADSILSLVEDDLYELFDSCIIGSFSDEVESISLNGLSSASLVLSCKNKKNVENVIDGLDDLDEDTMISFYPQVKKNKYLEAEVSYGNAVVITTTASSISKAVNKVYNEVKSIDFKGIHYRKDIGGIKE